MCFSLQADVAAGAVLVPVSALALREVRHLREVPLAVLLLEPRGARLRVAPFVGLGIVVSAYLAYALASGPVEVVAHSHALEYNVHLDAGMVWAVLYVVAVIGPSVLSGYQSVVLFGVLNLVGLSAAAALYVSAFASVWCVFAAMTSLLVPIHMYRRRHLPDPERLKGLTTG